ncbi:tRNA (N6-threonylcarbamoyladenosine(37)-N6)-methyltransferase TrmO [Shewanella yunxiaonensis]|uniref:tRNA (N6-threonylcarbamoyladenosine(37)-N6)-methyltransferase TrmO n=1 Tax=Shewanella yunxiaonensis TaxID=2829809 RepID=A0ABX7YX83_9GAMM|nr:MULTISPECIES: tRNA (N6-threonylcarbamoyladenosine(37)-N6)-methyltransferase TrmO [Shewanella]MDF0534883.1 tRNA (N6-threonylcarbamoyladenosine(37)-N6)-methyltransferase TrmO [Shewanella sp. A32]QUN07270.1 tRNA (N6-threonylcarbamoyladenosine(37)-N6)-methyltransferase TrmO [Shewanella yunxiaonensis]
MKIEYSPIGIIHSPFLQQAGTPVQPSRANNAEGHIELLPQFLEGLEDLQGFSHIVLLCHLHQCNGFQMKVTPYLDDNQRGLFATRSPRRPNPIGLSVVELLSIDNNILHIRNLDLLDGTPVLDIKPYVGEFDQRAGARFGWFENAKKIATADNRFCNNN